MTQEPIPNDGADGVSADSPPTFEDALMRLADAVRQLEEGNLSLDESLSRYEEGIRHLSQCQKILTSAERKIEVLSGFDSEGNPVTQAFDDEVTTLEEKAETRSKRRTANQSRKPTKKPRKAKATSVEADVNVANVSSETAPKGVRKRRPATRSVDTPESVPQDDVDSGGTLF